VRTIVGVLAVVLVLATVASANVSLQLKDASAETAAAKLTEQAKVSVLADPAVSAKITVSLTNMPLEKALDAVCAGSDLGWYIVRLDLPKDTKPDAEQIARIVRLLVSMDSSTFVTEQPGGAFGARIQRPQDPEAIAAVAEGDENEKLTKVYLITEKDLKAAAKPATNVDRMLDIQRQSLKLMLKLSPDEMAQMMDRSMELFMNMDPQERAAMMNRTLLSISKMNPDRFKAMVGEFINSVKDIPPETLKALADMWGVEPNQMPGGGPPPPPMPR
jgi:hypothetical protein